MQYHILLVEDQKEIRDMVAKYLVSENYTFQEACDGFEALSYFNQQQFHLVILDIMMPGIDGYEVLKEIRRISDVPVIMLTAKQSEIDKVKGFDIGADDYVVKPFSPRELVRRIKVFLKRSYPQKDEDLYEHGELKLYPKQMKLYKHDQEIILTSAEYNLLVTLFNNKDQVLTRTQLMELSFGYDYEGYDRNIDSYIKRIRQKIENDPKNPVYLKTKYGAGYVFEGGNIS